MAFYQAQQLAGKSRKGSVSPLESAKTQIFEVCRDQVLGLCRQLYTNQAKNYKRSKANTIGEDAFNLWLSAFAQTSKKQSQLMHGQIDFMQAFSSRALTLADALNSEEKERPNSLQLISELARSVRVQTQEVIALEAQVQKLSKEVDSNKKQYRQSVGQQAVAEQRTAQALLDEIEQLEMQFAEVMEKSEQGQLYWQLARQSAIDSIRTLSRSIGVFKNELTAKKGQYAQAYALLTELPEQLDQVTQDAIHLLAHFKQDYLQVLKKAEMKKRLGLARSGDALKNVRFVYKNPNSDKTQARKVATTELTIDNDRVEAESSSSIFSAPVVDMIPNDLLLFPYVMLAEANGEIIARKQLLDNYVGVADLEFENTAMLFQAVSQQQRRVTRRGLFSGKSVESTKAIETDTIDLPQYSGMLQRKIGGIEYKVFLQPLTLPQQLTPAKQLYLIGLVPSEKIRFEKLRVSPATAMWFVLLLVCLLAFIPLLKIRFVSASYTFTRTDISQAGLGSILLIGILCIGISDQFFFRYYQASKEVQGQSLFQQIQQEFAAELSAVRTQKERLQSEDFSPEHCLSRLNRNNPEREQLAGAEFVSLRNCFNPGLLIHPPTASADKSEPIEYLIEGMFTLDHNGMFHAMDSFAGIAEVDYLDEAYWLNSDLHIANDIGLSHRQYFQRALQCDLWGATAANCKNGFTIQRINNVRDARKNSQFAFAEYDSVFDTQVSERKVSSLGVKLRSFFHRVMPKDFGYLVFQNDGEVLYHIQERRSLLENIFVESNGNKQLASLVSHHKAEQTPATFNTTYRNSEHMFIAGKLHAELPWYLVVYQSQNAVMVGNMLLVFISISLFIALVTPLFIWCRYGTNQQIWRRLLTYRREQDYWSYSSYSTAAIFICLLSMGVVHELVLRLIIWLLSVLFVLVMMLSKLKLVALRKQSFKHVLFPFIAMLLLLILVAVLHLPDLQWGKDPTDIFALAVGMTLALAGIFVAKKWSSKLDALLKPVNENRYSAAYSWFILCLVWQLAVTPAMMIVNSANKYLLAHQASLHSSHLEVAQKDYTDAVDRYLELMQVEREEYRYQDWLSQDSLKVMYPASTLEAAWFPWVILNPADSEAESYQSDNTDFMIEALVQYSDISDSISAELHYQPQDQEAAAEKLGQLINYDADKFLMSAALWQVGLIAIISLLLLFGHHRLLRTYLIQRLLGEHLPDNFRLDDGAKSAQKIRWFKQALAKTRVCRVQLMRSSPRRALDLCQHHLHIKVWTGEVLSIEDCLEQQGNEFALATALRAQVQHEKLVVIITGLDGLVCGAENDKQALAYQCLRKLEAIPQLSIILLCEVAPLFRLCRNCAYGDIDEKDKTDAAQILAWSKLLSRFSKQYDWSPSQKYILPADADLYEFLCHESNGWPQLQQIKESFSQYHQLIKLQQVTADLDPATLAKCWSRDQIVEYFSSHAGAIYRQKWQECTREEKTLLYQLANGQHVNPQNLEVLEHLMRRGYLYRDAGWFIQNSSFRRFILSAESEETMAKWLRASDKSLWRLIRLPVMVTALVLLVLILIGSGEGLESILAILSALLGLIPLLLRNVSKLGDQSAISSD